MQEIITDIIELYHNELRNMEMYHRLLALVPNMQDEELILDIIDHTAQNILTLEQIYLGLTGNVIEKLATYRKASNHISYPQLLANALFSKTDTLERYELLYRMIPIQPYKDTLFNSIMCQLKDATTCNYLIATQAQVSK